MELKQQIREIMELCISSAILKPYKAKEILNESSEEIEKLVYGACHEQKILCEKSYVEAFAENIPDRLEQINVELRAIQATHLPTSVERYYSGKEVVSITENAILFGMQGNDPAYMVSKFKSEVLEKEYGIK
jgi:hypothetical protein